MAQMFSLGALGTWAVLHIVSLLFVWGFDLGRGECAEQT